MQDHSCEKVLLGGTDHGAQNGRHVLVQKKSACPGFIGMVEWYAILGLQVLHP